MASGGDLPGPNVQGAQNSEGGGGGGVGGGGGGGNSGFLAGKISECCLIDDRGGD